MNAQELLDKIKELPNKAVDVPTAPPVELVAMVVRWGRHLRQWKATTLADFARVSLSTVERVERGDKVSDEALDRIAQALGYETGAFTTPRPPIGPEKAAEQMVDTYGHLEPVAVAPMKTHKAIRDAARCHAYLIHRPEAPDTYDADIANLGEWLDLASFILSDILEDSPSERGRRDLYNDILACVTELERCGLTVLSGVMAAPQPGLPDWKVAIVSVTPRLTDPGAPKRRHVMVDRRCVALPPNALADAWAAASERRGPEMILFNIDGKGVTLEYEPDFGGESWVTRELDQHGEVTLSRVFTFQRSDLIAEGEDAPSTSEAADDDGDIIADVDDEGTVYRFRFATTKDDYYHIPGRVLGIDEDVLIVAEGLKLERKVFIAERNIGIFGRIAKLKQEAGQIVVGGDKEGSIPLDAFRELLERFPNSMEVDRYAAARVETILGVFFDGMKSARENYESYLDRRNAGARVRALRQDELLRAEIDKFIYLRGLLADWLAKATSYSEKEWQKMVVNVILLLFPKYVAVLENVRIADFYSTPGKRKNRFIDLCVVDANGNIDVIEIKKPFDDILLSRGLYRGNSVPTKELSGTIMQAEKYLFHLSKWGVDGEDELTARHGGSLPAGLNIKVTNPKALLLLGRDRRADGGTALSDSQAFDLEVIKRKYANMMDIVTYDDLLRRLDRIIASLTARAGASEEKTAAKPE